MGLFVFRLWFEHKFVRYEVVLTSLNIDFDLITAMPITISDVKSVQYFAPRHKEWLKQEDHWMIGS
jgi:hypothetical protein